MEQIEKVFHRKKDETWICRKLTELKRRFWAMLKGWNRFKFYNPEIDIKYIKTN